ncbi:MAG: hypothetical protein HN948_07860 [Clostridia bacterium]|nr:hypothetical protein [Clostridia bacterium]MBT7122909.1 hypothetical protein [Clostridia bacterium]
MRKKLVIMVALALVAAVVLCGCSLGGNSVTGDIYDRLDKLDDFKESAQTRVVPAQSPQQASRYGAFRGVPFGYSRQDVLGLETLALFEEFDNALDFEHVSIFGYDMLPTYWFNGNDQLFRGSYYTQASEDMHYVIDSLLEQLTDLYGTALETSYYDYDNFAVYFDNEQQASEAVGNGNAYFYAWFFAEDVDIEVYIEGASKSEVDFRFDVFVNFTDYVYSDG